MRRQRAPKQLDAAKLAPVLHELLPIGDGEPPLQVLGYHDRQGVCRRIVATYPNGWIATVRLNAQLAVTSTSARIKFGKIGK